MRITLSIIMLFFMIHDGGARRRRYSTRHKRSLRSLQERVRNDNRLDWGETESSTSPVPQLNHFRSMRVTGIHGRKLHFHEATALKIHEGNGRLSPLDVKSCPFHLICPCGREYIIRMYGLQGTWKEI